LHFKKDGLSSTVATVVWNGGVLGCVVKGQLTLQKFWFYIQPTLRTMDIMASIATSINRVSAYFTRVSYVLR